MMKKKSVKYLINQVNPDMILNLFMTIRKNEFYSKQDIEEKLQKKGELTRSFSKYIKEISVTLSQFGIVDINASDGSFCLSGFGIKLKKILLKNKSLFFEIYQLLSYYNFDLNGQRFDLLSFRSYQILCDYIYDSEHITNTKAIADYVDSKIKSTYNVIGSFSEVCITRGIAWLKELDPPVIDDSKKRTLRKPNHHSIILLSLDYYYRLSNLQYNDPLFIDSQVKEKLSRPILVSPEYIDDILKELSIIYPQYLQVKYNITGTYVILCKEINIADMYR